VSRIFEYLKPADPLDESDIIRFENYLAENLQNLFSAVNQYGIAGLIGSSGSFESLADIIVKDTGPRNSLKGKTEYLFSEKDLKALHVKLVKSTAFERSQMKGLVPYRIETIPLASTFINYIIKKFSPNKIRLSTYSLREGVISELELG
jgi:exopolyphosphatase/guanosine-5'-triphosphate,3'-diphosphate pyrophosphatase